MKKLIIIILIVGVVGGLIYFKNKAKPAKESEAPQTSTFKPDPSSATFSFDGESVTLSNGKKVTTDTQNGMTDETELLSMRSSGDINNDGKEDTAVFLTQSGGGSGTFLYVAAYISSPVSYKGTNAIFLGDRIIPQSLTISNGILTAKWLDRKVDEHFSAEPTIPTTRQFVFKNGELVEK